MRNDDLSSERDRSHEVLAKLLIPQAREFLHGDYPVPYIDVLNWRMACNSALHTLFGSISPEAASFGRLNFDVSAGSNQDNNRMLVVGEAVFRSAIKESVSILVNAAEKYSSGEGSSITEATEMELKHKPSDAPATKQKRSIITSRPLPRVLSRSDAESLIKDSLLPELEAYTAREHISGNRMWLSQWKQSASGAVAAVSDSELSGELGAVVFDLPASVPSHLMTLDDVAKQFRSGKTHALRILHSALEYDRTSFHSIEARRTDYIQGVQQDSHSVFIVHGHDDLLRERVARFVESKLGLKAIILHERPNKGATLIEKFEREASVGYAIVLLSPDDRCRASTDENTKRLIGRARQNVILELGYFVGRLGRERVSAIIKGSVEKPSDIHGIVYLNYDDGAWEKELTRELDAAGLDVNKDWFK